MTSIEARLDALRGSARPLGYTARTIIALTANPGCSRRALMDASGTDKKKVVEHMDFPASFGQSPIALVRGNAFEAQLKADGGAALLRLLREKLAFSVSGTVRVLFLLPASLTCPGSLKQRSCSVRAVSSPTRAAVS